jgi:hypothetical protein
MMALPKDARDLIKLSLKGLAQDPDYETDDGLGFLLVHESGLTLYLLLRTIEVKSFFRRVNRLRIALYGDSANDKRVMHFMEIMDLPRSASDMQFLMVFTPKVIAMIRAVAHLEGAGRLLDS